MKDLIDLSQIQKILQARVRKFIKKLGFWGLVLITIAIILLNSRYGDLLDLESLLP